MASTAVHRSSTLSLVSEASHSPSVAPPLNSSSSTLSTKREPWSFCAWLDSTLVRFWNWICGLFPSRKLNKAVAIAPKAPEKREPKEVAHGPPPATQPPIQEKVQEPSFVAGNYPLYRQQMVKHIDSKHHLQIGEKLRLFESVEKFFLQAKSPKEAYQLFNRSEVAGFLHTSTEWQGEEKALYAQVENGLRALHTAFEQCTPEELFHSLLGINACFHAATDALIALLMSKNRMDYIPNCRPQDTPLERVCELFRVYQNIQIEAEAKRRNISIEVMRRDEPFTTKLLEEKPFLDWCEQEKLIGWDTPCVHFNEGCSGILFRKQAAQVFHDQILPGYQI